MTRSYHPILQYSPAILILAAVIADSRQSADTDMWWHLTAGHELLAHGSWPRENPYSYSVVGYPWLHHEWLSEVVMAWMYNHFGASGLKAVKLFCSLGIFSMLTVADAELEVAVGFHAIVTLPLALIVMPILQFRPQMFDFFFLATIVALLVRDSRRDAAPIWPAIPVVALWSQMHGSFVVGIAALGAYGGMMAVRDLIVRRNPSRGISIVAITFVAAASTLITFAIPPARDTWRSVYESMTNPMTPGTIADWKPLLPAIVSAYNTGGEARRYFLLVATFLAAGIASIMATRRIEDLPLIAVAATMLAAAAMTVRSIPFAAIAVAPLLASNLTRLFGPRASQAAQETTVAHPRMRIATALVIAAATLAYAKDNHEFSRGIDSSEYPAGAMDFMNTHGLKGNVLADFGWGSYVTWRDAAHSKVFIDGRYDLAYPPQVTLDYGSVQSGDRARGASVLKAYPHDYVLVQTDSPAAHLVEAQVDWITIYSDPLATLYARRGSAATDIAGIPITGPRLTTELR